MLISNYVHLPISTTNASTSSLERDNAKKRSIQGPSKTGKNAAKSTIMEDNTPRHGFMYLADKDDDQPQQEFEQNFAETLEQAINQDVGSDQSWSQSNHHTWQQSMAVSIANEPLLLSTGKEPTLGLLFYDQPIKAKMVSWSSSMIPMILEEECPSEFSIEPYQPLKINHQRTINNHYLSQSIHEDDLNLPLDFTITLTEFEKALNLKSKAELDKEKTSSILRKRPRLITEALKKAANDDEHADLDPHTKIDVKV
jgi:hypothetical protein